MIEQLLSVLNSDPKIRTATKYVGPKSVIRLTRRVKYRKNNRRNEFVLTIGQPNYLEAKFVKLCVKAGEPFPVKKIQFKYYPVKKKAKNG
jgi:hypothetical protein